MASPFSVFRGSIVGVSIARSVFNSSGSVDLSLIDFGPLTSGEYRAIGRTPGRVKL